MSAKYLAFIASSLHGFIARRNGDLDWLPEPGDSTEDYGYSEFISSIDTLVIGRNTFEKVLTFGDWPYPGKRVVVLSSTLNRDDIPEMIRGEVELYSGSIESLTGFLESSGVNGVYVDGGQAIQSFIKAGKINEITITYIPVLIGSGISLFGDVDHDIKLEHVSTQSFESGLVQSTYRIKV